MRLYHASFIPIPKPDLDHSRSNVDFGRGFYTTPIRNQALKWCGRFKHMGMPGIISRYQFDESAYEALKVLRFETYSDQWLVFILTCRSGNDTSDYDIVIGGIADDKVFSTIELYLDRLISKSEAIQRLRYEKPNLQICFRSKIAIAKCLKFEGSESV